MELALFFLLASITAVSSLLVIILRNPVASAISLVICFLSLAGIYALLDAPFIAVIQVMVYAGAIMVLFLFIIMMLNLSEAELGQKKITLTKVMGIIVVGYILLKGFAILRRVSTAKVSSTLSQGFGTTEVVGRSLFTDYLLPFELTSLILLVAIIGAVLLAKR